MIICPECSKENQDHYKFCLGCGTELPKDAPKQFTAELRMPPEPEVHPEPEPVIEQAPEPSAPPACPQCGHPNAEGNRFCASCGYKLGAAIVTPESVAPPPAPAPVAESNVYLTALRADGTEAGNYRLPAEPVVKIGRDTGTIFAGDSYLSPEHAHFHLAGARITVSDVNSLNGVYVKLAPHTAHLLLDGDVFRIGQEIIRYETLDSEAAVEGVARLGSPARDIVGRIALVIGRQTTGNAFSIPGKGLHLGRERGDVLFSDDGYVSGLHCKVGPGDDAEVYITHLGSSNGTFVRVRKNHALSPADILLMGQQVFRIDF